MKILFLFHFQIFKLDKYEDIYILIVIIYSFKVYYISYKVVDLVAFIYLEFCIKNKT